MDAVAISCCKQADPLACPSRCLFSGRKKCCHGNLVTPASVHFSAHREVKGGQGADAKLPQERLLGLLGALGPLLSTCTKGRITQNLGDLYTLLHHIPNFYNCLDKVPNTNNSGGGEFFLFIFFVIIIFVSQFKVRQSTTVEKPWQGGAQSTIARDHECD